MPKIESNWKDEKQSEIDAEQTGKHFSDIIIPADEQKCSTSLIGEQVDSLIPEMTTEMKEQKLKEQENIDHSQKEMDDLVNSFVKTNIKHLLSCGLLFSQLFDGNLIKIRNCQSMQVNSTPIIY